MNGFSKIFKAFCLILFLKVLSSILNPVAGQMRQMYEDSAKDNKIEKISFYSPSSGFVAFTNWLGFTTDSGRTFTKKFITRGNVDYGSYGVNILFGFEMNGVKAFDKDNIVVYGEYGFVPSILYSSNGGNSFKLVFHSKYDPMQLRRTITDMSFLPDGKTGYATDADRVLKTTNGGISWSNALIAPESYFDNVEASNNQVIAFSSDKNTNKLIRSTNGGLSWQNMNLPVLKEGKVYFAHFLNISTGWLSMLDAYYNGYFYKTTDGGNTWKQLNNIKANNFSSFKIVFTDENTGYALGGRFHVLKTLNGGVTWEVLPRDNDYNYGDEGNNDLQCLSPNQLWVGGDHGFLQMTTNGGGTPLPAAYFEIDTAGVFASGKVNLVNYSRTGYSSQWFLNGQQISTSFHASYQHDVNRIIDTLKLIVSNGVYSDTTQEIHSFQYPVTISSFSPVQGAAGTTITITGSNFWEIKYVSFGGVPAASFKVLSATSLTAVVGAGASGSVLVNTPKGQGTKGGFIFISPPVITSFTPVSAAFNTPVTINGSQFTNVSSVLIGGMPALSFRTVSSTQIIANAPSGPAGKITVTTPGGTDSLAGYSSIGKVNSFTPLQGTQGTLVHISGTSFDSVSGVTIGGVNALSFNVNSYNSITAIAGAGSTGEVKVIYATGSSSSPGFSWYPAPVLSGFSPTSGPVGITVTLTGSGFNPVANLNTVYFGTLKAVVSAATGSTITAKVPAGAIFENISVTNHSLIGYSRYPFLVTFPNGGTIAPSSFEVALNMNFQANMPRDIGTADLDHDGKIDFILTYYNSHNNAKSGIFVYRNTSTLSRVSFAEPVQITGPGMGEIKTGDFDGDGKIDVLRKSESGMILFRNTSTPGNLSFSAGIAIEKTDGTGAIAITDIDKDGKVDIVATNSKGTWVYRNVSEPGAFNFVAGVMVASVNSTRNILTADLNGDHKDDIIISGQGFLINQSTKGNISFKSLVALPISNHSYISAGDMDGDGKTDIVAGNYEASSVAVLLNTTIGENVSFASPAAFSATFNPAGITVSDMDGEGKLDIVATLSDQAMTILKNTSTPGKLSFATQVNYLPGNYGTFHLNSLGDFNNDGKIDAVSISETGKSLIVFVNAVSPLPFIQSFTPTLGMKSTLVTLTGTNFTGTTSVKFGGIEATSFTVVSASKITAVVASGATGDVTVTNNKGEGSLAGFVYGQPPLISSVTPLKGDVGATVTLTGANFSPVLQNNIVSFGGLKARVLTATSTIITVQVPFGSIYKPISITVGGTTASSSESFLTTFPNGSTQFDKNSFAPRIDISQNWNGELADIDGDGSLDLLSMVGNNVAVGLNTSTSGNISFAPMIAFPTPGSVDLTGQADLDGDGKTDIAVISGKIKLYFLRNTSAPGNVSFDTATEYKQGLHNAAPTSLDIADVDGDGKPDLVTISYDASFLSIFKNASSPGNIAFSTQTVIDLAHDGMQVYLRDLNGDGKPEIICSGSNFAGYVFRNTSTPGNISFAPKIEFGRAASMINIADIDGDGKADIVCLYDKSFSVYKNGSTEGNIQFSPEVNFPTGLQPILSRIFSNDLDGDGKPDIYTTNFDGNNLFVFKNSSTPGNISFGKGMQYEVIKNSLRSSSGDLDGDGKPDLLIVGYGLTILRNTSGEANGPEIIDFTPVSGMEGTSLTIRGNNLTGSTHVSLGGVPAASFKVVSDHEIAAVAGAGASGIVAVTSAAGSGSLPGFIYSNQPVITLIAPAVAVPGSTVTITGANLSLVNAVHFGKIPAASFIVHSSTNITAVTGEGAHGIVTVSTPDTTVEYTKFKLLLPPSITSFTPTSGRGGHEITITGTHFSNVTSVTFGGNNAISFKVVSPTLITANVGNGATGNVTVTTESGTASLPGYTYLSSAQPSTFYPASGRTGSAIIINGFNIASATNVFFGGSPAASFTVESSSRIIAIVGEGASGDISIINPMGTYKRSGFTFINDTKPDIAFFTPAIGGTGTVVTITGNNFNETSKVNFNDVPAASFTIESSEVIKAILGAGGSGNLSITSPNGTDTMGGFIFTKAPVISSFTPQKAEAGSTVTIKGTNFSSAAGLNTVYFGTVKGIVTSASFMQLTVTVPEGATYKPISVTANALTGYSKEFFLPLYAQSGPLSAESYASRIDSFTAKTPHQISVGDVDGDMKPDLAVFSGEGYAEGNISFFRNISQPGILKLAPQKIKSTEHSPLSNHFTDCNGDGLLDMVTILTNDYNAVKIYQNNSSPGTIAFSDGPGLTFNLADFSGGTADFDGDGKPDIAVAGFYSRWVGIYKNTSTKETLSFATKVIFDVGIEPYDVRIIDIDGDGKPDILITGSGPYTILRNTSTEGNISFEKVTPDLAYLDRNVIITTADIDGDGRPDFIFTKRTGVVVLRNKSLPGDIRMAPAELFLTGGDPNSFDMADLDGNGLIDIVVTHKDRNTFAILSNTSTPGKITFNPPITYATSTAANSVSVADIDADGRPDLMMANTVSNSITILKQQFTGPVYTLIKVCEKSDTTLVSNITGTTYKWQQNTGNGFTDLTNNANISGVNISKLTLKDIPLSWNNYTYSCMVDGAKASSELKLILQASVVPAVSVVASDTTSCMGATLTFNAVITNGGDEPGLEWKKNGVSTGIHSPQYSKNDFANGDLITVALTSNAACAFPLQVTSNPVRLVVNSQETGITISGNPVVSSGQPAKLVSSITNGGKDPIYQWQDSTASHTWQDIPEAVKSNFDYLPALSGDKIRCRMTSSEKCADGLIATSNVLELLVNSGEEVTGIKFYPNPIQSSLTIDSLKLSDKWESLEIVNLSGLRVLVKDIKGLTKVTVQFNNLGPGMYIAILRRSEGEPVFLRFVKL